MAIIKVIAGDLRKGKQRIDPNWVKTAELQTEEKLKKLSGSAGWGFTGAVVGGLLTGGIGLAVGGLAGILSGGNKTEVCFSCELEDGRKFLAITDQKTWQKVIATLFDKNQAQPSQIQTANELVIPKIPEEEDNDQVNPNQPEISTNEVTKFHSERNTWTQTRDVTMSFLSRFWKWYISGFTSRPDKALYESPRFYRIILTFLVFSGIGNLLPKFPRTSISSPRASTTNYQTSRKKTEEYRKKLANSEQNANQLHQKGTKPEEVQILHGEKVTKQKTLGSKSEDTAESILAEISKNYDFNRFIDIWKNGRALYIPTEAWDSLTDNQRGILTEYAQNSELRAINIGRLKSSNNMYIDSTVWGN